MEETRVVLFSFTNEHYIILYAVPSSTFVDVIRELLYEET